MPYQIDAGSPDEDLEIEQDEDPHREATRGVGPVTGAAGSEAGSVDRASPFPVKPKGSRCSYQLEPFTYFRTRAGHTGPVHSRLVGRHALLVEVDGAAAALALATWARARPLGVDEVVPAARSVLFDGVVDVSALTAQLAAWTPGEPSAPGPLVEVGVDYDGPDLAFVADAWGTDVAGVVETHTSTEFVAAFCGFAPGFSYLDGLPDERAVPRLDSPRARVRAGSVGLAGSWCGVYPTDSPGGWRLLGTTDATLWDATRAQPALLAPGTRVRFVAR